MSLLRRFSSRLYALAPKRMQYIITEGKRRLRRLTVEPRLIREAQRRNDELKKKLCGKETINVDSMWKYDALFAAMLRHRAFGLYSSFVRRTICRPANRANSCKRRLLTFRPKASIRNRLVGTMER